MSTSSDRQIDERYEPAKPDLPHAFAEVVCGIDGSPASQEAARQAAVLDGGR